MMENSARLAQFVNDVGHCMKHVIKILFILRLSAALVGASLNYGGATVSWEKLALADGERSVAVNF